MSGNPKTYLSGLEKSGFGSFSNFGAEPLPDLPGWFRVSCNFTTSDSNKSYFGVGEGMNKFSAELSACEEIVDKLKLENFPSSAGSSEGNSELPTLPIREQKSSSGSRRLSDPIPPAKIAENDDDLKCASEEKQIYYFKNKELGHGAAGWVYEGFFEVPGKKVAVKKCFINSIKAHKIPELEIMQKFEPSPPNAVHYYASAKKGDFYYIAIDLAKCSLYDLFRLDSRQYESQISYEHLRNIALGSAIGLDYLHGKKIIHRDLKPANVLIFPNYIAKLADFGISREVRSVTQGTETRADKGTLAFMPPEAFQKLPAGKKFKLNLSFDIFGLGVVIFYAITKGKHLFAEADFQNSIQIHENIKANKPNWTGLNPVKHYALKDLVEKLVKPQPSDRPSASEIIKHPLLWDDEKFLRFIEGVSGDAQLRNPKSEPRKKLEEKYKKMCMQLVIQTGWKNRLHPDLQAFCLQQDELRDAIKARGERYPMNLKPYFQHHFMKLIEFIRDHKQHSADIDSFRDGVLNGDWIFGKGRQNYGNYFMQAYPELSTWLYRFLQDNVGFQGFDFEY